MNAMPHERRAWQAAVFLVAAVGASPSLAAPLDCDTIADQLRAAGGHHDPTYAAMISSIDESVGRVLQALDELDLAGNTIVMFTSDNGGVGGYEREGLRSGKKGKGDVTDNTPLRSGKGRLYEGGIRVPLIVRWPGLVTPGSTGDEPAS